MDNIMVLFCAVIFLLNLYFLYKSLEYIYLCKSRSMNSMQFLKDYKNNIYFK